MGIEKIIAKSIPLKTIKDDISFAIKLFLPAKPITIPTKQITSPIGYPMICLIPKPRSQILFKDRTSVQAHRDGAAAYCQELGTNKVNKTRAANIDNSHNQ